MYLKYESGMGKVNFTLYQDRECTVNLGEFKSELNAPKKRVEVHVKTADASAEQYFPFDPASPDAGADAVRWGVWQLLNLCGVTDVKSITHLEEWEVK